MVRRSVQRTWSVLYLFGLFFISDLNLDNKARLFFMYIRSYIYVYPNIYATRQVSGNEGLFYG